MDLKTKGLVLRNAFSMLSIRILTPLAGFLLFVVVSRKLGPLGLGKYSLILTLFTVTQHLPFLGLHSYIVREVAKNKNLIPPFISNMLFISLAVSLAVSGAVYFGVKSLQYPPDVVRAVMILTIAILVNTAASLSELILIGAEKMQWIAYAALTENIVRLLLSGGGVMAGYGLLYLTVILALTRGGSALAYFLYLSKLFPSALQSRLDPSFCKGLLKTCPVFLAIHLLTVVLFRVDFLMLSKLRSFEELGFYTAAYRIMEVCTLLSSTFLLALFPMLSRLQMADPAELEKLTRNTTKYLFLAMMFLGVSIFISAGPVISLLYGPQYGPAARVLKYMIVAVLFICLDQIFAGLLLAAGRQKEDLKALCFSAIVYVILLAVFIPKYGVYGAAWATALAYLVQTSFSYFYMSKSIVSLDLFNLIGKTAAAGAGTVLLAVFFPGIFWVWSVGLAACVYFLLLLFFKVIRFREIAALLKWKDTVAA